MAQEEALVQEGKHSKTILTAIGEIEQGLQNESVFNRVQAILPHK